MENLMNSSPRFIPLDTTVKPGGTRPTITADGPIVARIVVAICDVVEEWLGEPLATLVHEGSHEIPYAEVANRVADQIRQQSFRHEFKHARQFVLNSFAIATKLDGLLEVDSKLVMMIDDRSSAIVQQAVDGVWSDWVDVSKIKAPKVGSTVKSVYPEPRSFVGRVISLGSNGTACVQTQGDDVVIANWEDLQPAGEKEWAESFQDLKTRVQLRVAVTPWYKKLLIWWLNREKWKTAKAFDHVYVELVRRTDRELARNVDEVYCHLMAEMYGVSKPMSEK